MLIHFQSWILIKGITMKNPAATLSGMLELVPASKNRLAPIFEAITNSLESIFELELGEQKTIEITLIFNDTDSNCHELDGIEIHDEGAGFNDKSYKRFKELLNKSKGNRNRGTGRLQYLHRFDSFVIESTFIEKGVLHFRNLACNNTVFINELPSAESSKKSSGTLLRMLNFKPHKGDKAFFAKLSITRLASLLKSKFALRAHLDNKQGRPFPVININYKYIVSKEVDIIVIDSSSLPKPVSEGQFSVDYKIPELDKKSNIKWKNSTNKEPESFNWAVFEFNEDDIESHEAFLCSKDIAVQSIKNPLINKGTGYKGIKKVTAFYGAYLDQPEHVNQAVDSFCIKKKSDINAGDLMGSLIGEDDYVYMDDIEAAAKKQIRFIYEEIASAQEANERRKYELAKSLGISSNIANEVKVSPLDDDDFITRSLYQKEAEYLADKSNEAREILKDMDFLDPTSEDYQDNLEMKSTELTAVLDEQNKEELSKYVVRRELVVSLLDKILNMKLDVQNKPLPKGKNRDKEGFIHDLIFKRKRKSGPNDLWILNEDFVHYDACSDLEIKDITDSNGVKLLENLTPKFIKEFGIKVDRRPDVFLFTENESCILIEFKAPDVDLSDYLNQMTKYCTLIANYSNNKYTSFFCYLIGERINTADLDGTYKRTPNGDWLNPRIPIVTHDEERRDLGVAQLEIIKLSNIHKRAQRRNKSFSEKLGLDLIIK